MWAGILEAGSTHSWAVLEVDGGGGPGVGQGSCGVTAETLTVDPGSRQGAHQSTGAGGSGLRASKATDTVKDDPQQLRKCLMFLGCRCLPDYVTGQLSAGPPNGISVKYSLASPPSLPS